VDLFSLGVARINIPMVLLWNYNRFFLVQHIVVFFIYVVYLI